MAPWLPPRSRPRRRRASCPARPSPLGGPPCSGEEDAAIRRWNAAAGGQSRDESGSGRGRLRRRATPCAKQLSSTESRRSRAAASLVVSPNGPGLTRPPDWTEARGTAPHATRPKAQGASVARPARTVSLLRAGGSGPCRPTAEQWPVPAGRSGRIRRRALAGGRRATVPIPVLLLGGAQHGRRSGIRRQIPRAVGLARPGNPTTVNVVPEPGTSGVSHQARIRCRPPRGTPAGDAAW